MGALNPLTMLSTIQQGVNIFEGLANSEVSYNQNVQSEDVALKQLQEQQALQQKQAMQNAELQRQKIATNTAINEENRRAALKRAVARQKARYGASGVTSSGGSSEAVLLGMFDETADELAQRERLDTLRYSALDSSLAQGSALNVLQYQQLKERQNLNNIATNYNRIRNMADFGFEAYKFGEKLYENS